MNGRTEGFDREAQPFGAAAFRRYLSSAGEREHPAARGKIRRKVQRMDDIDESVGDQHADNFAIPVQMPDAMNAVIAWCCLSRFHF